MSLRDLLLLFPERRLGVELIERAARRYRWLILVSDEPAARPFQELGRRLGLDIVARPLRLPAHDAIRDLLTDGWQRVFGVINFVGTDWMTMRVEGSEARWSIDANKPEHARLAVVGAVLRSAPAGRLAWINLAYGRHRVTPEGEWFCNTRYGLRGFRAAIQLDPSLGGVRIRNVCMNYFLSKGARPHCRNCVSEEMADLAHRRMSRREMASFTLELLERVAAD